MNGNELLIRERRLAEENSRNKLEPGVQSSLGFKGVRRRAYYCERIVMACRQKYRFDANTSKNICALRPVRCGRLECVAKFSFPSYKKQARIRFYIL